MIKKKLDNIERGIAENNKMLRYIVEYINAQRLNADLENMNDFIRNIWANLYSNAIDGNIYRNN